MSSLKVKVIDQSSWSQEDKMFPLATDGYTLRRDDYLIDCRVLSDKMSVRPRVKEIYTVYIKERPLT